MVPTSLEPKLEPENSSPGTFEKLREHFEKLRGQDLFQNSFLSMQRHRVNVKFSQKLEGLCPSSPKVGGANAPAALPAPGPMPENRPKGARLPAQIPGSKSSAPRFPARVIHKIPTAKSVNIKYTCIQKLA